MLLLALTLAATPAADPKWEPRDGPPQYVADRIPSRSVTLDYNKICDGGFVDPQKLAVQLIVQLEMFEDIRSSNAQEAVTRFNGVNCPEDARQAMSPRQTAYCTASIVVQRMALNVYPGFKPVARRAEPLGLDRNRDLKVDVSHPGLNRPGVAAFADAFLRNPPKERYIECDYAPEKYAEGEPEEDAMERSGLWAGAAEFGHQGARFLKVLQFRQYPGNLAYRGANDSLDKAHATFAAGRDLYLTDGGFTISHSHDTGDEIDPARKRTYERKLVGAIGIPLCGLIGLKGDDCQSAETVPGTKIPRRTYNLIPYFAWDERFKKQDPLNTNAPPSTSRPSDQTEAGAVAFLATDQTADRCRRWLGLEPAACGSFYMARAYRLDNELDHSVLDAVSLRYTPVFKSARPGLTTSRLDLCVNTLCGDPDRIVRLGLLLDARYNQGWFGARGTNAAQVAFNEDYARIGGRVGFLGVFNATPDIPVSFWAAYTDFHALKGFDRDLGEVQTQVSFNFSAATLSLSWRNGRREDTAKRDSTYAVSLGFKTK